MNIHKAIAALLAVSCMAASAATVYRDRPVPVPVLVGDPCFVTFKGWRINVNMISTFAVETVAWLEKDDAKSSAFSYVTVEKSYEAFIIRLATGAKFEERQGDLKAQVEAFHALIRSCKR